MAEITSTNSRQDHKRRQKKLSTRVDLTPMVDLGFLLITFFVFTKSLSEAKLMELMVPNDKQGPTSQVCESCALTVIAAKNDQLYYYEGSEDTATYRHTTYGSNGIRDIIVSKKHYLKRVNPEFELQLIIKPTADASFKNLVDLVDEAAICALKRYYIDEPSVKDIRMAR